MWDDRIDEAAREVTRGTPGGDFKARVLERIEREGDATNAGRAWTRGLLWIAPAAAAAALLVAVAIYRTNPASPVQTIEAPGGGSAEIRLRPDPTIVSPTIAAPAMLAPEIAREVRTTPDATDAMSNVDTVSEDTDAIAFEPLAIGPIEIAAVENVDTVIEPLTLSDIDVPALDQ